MRPIDRRTHKQLVGALSTLAAEGTVTKLRAASVIRAPVVSKVPVPRPRITRDKATTIDRLVTHGPPGRII